MKESTLKRIEFLLFRVILLGIQIFVLYVNISFLLKTAAWEMQAVYKPSMDLFWFLLNLFIFIQFLKEYHGWFLFKNYI